MIQSRSEVSAIAYKLLISDAERYGEILPEYGKSLKVFMADDKIVVWEYRILRQMVITFHAEKPKNKLKQIKAELKKQIK